MGKDTSIMHICVFQALLMVKSRLTNHMVFTFISMVNWKPLLVIKFSLFISSSPSFFQNQLILDYSVR